MPHLFVDISSHGFGHLGQVAPVLNALCDGRPVTLTIRSGLPATVLRRRLAAPFRHIPEASDFGYVMHTAIDLDLSATALRYQAFHQDWPAKVAAEAQFLSSLGVDAVFSDVAYLPLAGAAQAGIPAVAMCSLNWAELFRDNFGSEDWAETIAREMTQAYQSAQVFLRVSPGLPMADLVNRREIGPVCAMAAADRPGVAAQLGLALEQCWVLLAMGGIELPLDLACWPVLPNIQYLVPRSLYVARPDVVLLDDEKVDFKDVLAAVDVVLTKPGYGAFVEAACHGKAVLYVTRTHWKEGIFLADWLHRHARARVVSREMLLEGELAEALAAVLAQTPPAVPAPSGVREAVAVLEACLASS